MYTPYAVRGGLLELQNKLNDFRLHTIVVNLPGAVLDDLDDITELSTQLVQEYTVNRDTLQSRVTELEAENTRLSQIVSEYWLLEQKRRVKLGIPPPSPIESNNQLREEFRI